METVDRLGDNAQEGTVGGGGPVGRPRSRVGLLAAALVTVLATGTVLLGAQPAAAAPATTSATAMTTTSTTSTTSTTHTATQQDDDAARTASPTPFPQFGTLPPDTGSPAPSPTDRPAVRPSIADPGDVTTATVRLHGAGTPGHRLRVTGPAATGSSGCTTTVATDGSWSCIATVHSGPQQVFTVADETDAALGSSRAPASDVVVPPAVMTDGPTSGPVSGTGLPGATVAVSVSGTPTDRTARVDAGGRWTVALPGSARDGRITVSAAQTASTANGFRSDLRSAPSAPRTVVVDRTAPAAPVVTTPESDERVRSQPFTVRGTGEPGAVLTVYVDRSPVCRSDVGADGRWACTTTGATAPAGTRVLSAMQQDAAGNSSPSSSGVRVVLSDATAAPSAGPSASASGAPGGQTSSSGTPGTTPDHTSGATDGTGTPTDTGTSGGGSTGTAGGSGTAGAGGSTSGVPDWSGPAGDWTADTAYDRGVPTIQASFSWGTVLLATGVAAGFLVLVAVPLAVVGAAARGRLRNPFAALLGRNRSRTERRLGDEVLPTWAAAAVGVGIVVVTTLLGVGVALEARYVRLALAVLLGSAVTTGVVVLATRWAAGKDRAAVGFRVSPWLVLAAVLGCALTRVTDLSPALVVGAVLVPVGRPGADTAALRLGSSLARGVRSATARSAALLGVATVGWVLHSLVHGSGFWTTLTAEFATTLCVGAVGALVVSLLPLPGSTGAVLVAGARARWVGLTAAGVALAAVTAGAGAPAVPSPTETAVASALCAAAVACCWVWLRGSRTAAQHR
ncbi:Ig-like domain-containing protein [Curtobacterium sp. P97]|uniref:Ig-like domain-containing protein n=1 Tax=Curtobacterium sp. P97 TaxID=2939562 RepID=UPI00203A4C9B|nr:Ig-like domain-containing protein [Curtobacterium sp. P97]MCM3520928.1 Ig-like domain-containing protein [Curtobacterium sp. P97]